MKKAKTLFCDATFDYCPSKYYQLFSAITIDESSGISTPCFWAFMSSKKKELYDSIFTLLKSWFQSKNALFEPNEVYADFEVAIHLSIRNNFPRAQIKCCYFHLLQSWWRYAGNSGLKQEQILSFTKTLIENFKIAIHLPDQPLRIKFLNDVKKLILDDNKLNMPSDIKLRMKLFHDYIIKFYFDTNSSFGKYVLHRLFNINVFFYFILA